MTQPQLIEKAGEKQGRAVQVPNYFQRVISPWFHPTVLNGEQWRSVVKNQGVAITCRDTIIKHIKNLDWAIIPFESEDSPGDMKEEIDYYTELFQNAEGDFDRFVDLVLQDAYDLPFGSGVEVIREGDKEDGRIVQLDHIDGATLFPTYNHDFPVVQYTPHYKHEPIYFPKHAIERVYMSPSPQIRRKGWGIAPPEKIYLSIQMLYRGDTYYAGLLLDTPEAGILDLGDMSKQSAQEWLEGFRSLFQGIDGFKVPVLYEHTSEAKWIPFGRSPNDMLYDSTTHKYAKITAAGYGLRLSDIGMEEAKGGGTMAGVIRDERQSKRSGYAEARTMLLNFFNRLLRSFGLQFIWIETDTEDASMRGSAMLTVSQALQTAVSAGFIHREEARKQIIKDGLMTIEIDPEDMPEDPMEKQQRMMQEQGGGGLSGLFGGNKKDDKKVPASQGGQTDVKPAGRFAKITRMFRKDVKRNAPPKTHTELLSELGSIIDNTLAEIVSNMGNDQIAELVKPTTTVMFPTVKSVFPDLDEHTIERSWLPNMQAVTFDSPSFFDGDEEVMAILRAQDDEIRQELDKLLDTEEWWRVASAVLRARLMDVFTPAYERGLFDSALAVARALYEAGLRDTPELIGLNFNLTNPSTLTNLETDAATLVRRIDEGTRFYIKQSLIAGVREGLSSPEIARAISDGADLEEILASSDFTTRAINAARNTMQDISERRAESIVNTEINRAENKAHYDQYIHLGLREKQWKHLGKRGITDKGNPHPCVVCTDNENAGAVPMDFEYKTVFKNETTQYPPGHPGVCHCKVMFVESDLFEVVGAGDFAPLTGS